MIIGTSESLSCRPVKRRDPFLSKSLLLYDLTLTGFDSIRSSLDIVIVIVVVHSQDGTFFYFENI